MLQVTSDQSEQRVLPAVDDITVKARAYAAYYSFLEWAQKYGYDLRDSPNNAKGVSDRYESFLGLSAALSASFNFGYDPGDQSIYIVVEQEEFEWLPWLAIEEVVIGSGLVHVLTKPLEILPGEVLPPMALQIWTNQPKVWRSFPSAKEIGFMCIHWNKDSFLVREFSAERFPVRYLQ